MLNPEVQKELEKQQYRLIGSHSAVKVCGWTKSTIRGTGQCYKHTFYGINSAQCLQMTTCLSCANRCLFCWRGYKAPVSKEWQGDVNKADFILQESIKEHLKLLQGFRGSSHFDEKAFKKSQEVRHVALSLTGEPIIYPYINELIKLFHQQRISTFMVTNAQCPEAIKYLSPVTQLYLSLDAPNEKILKKIDVPLFSDYWERLLRSLSYLAEKKQRTCLRLTLVKGYNMVLPEEYASLIKLGNPNFVEVKAYMHVGQSQMRLKQENMPLHPEVMAFSQKILNFLPDYEIIAEHLPSRVVLLAHKKFYINNQWHIWIDFDQFFKGEGSYSRPASPEHLLKK